MPLQEINEHDVPIVQTGHGMTQWLVKSEDGSGPSIMIRHWGPNTDIPVHAHPYNEMFYVLEGEVIMGDTVYGPGSCLFYPKGTPYGPTRAPNGCKLLRYAEAGRD